MGIFLLLLCILGLYWLTALIVFLGLLVLLVLWGIDQIKSNRLKRFIRFFSIFFLVFLVVLSIRLFVFEVYTVPSNSMENTVYTGDIIAVNKLIYGPGIPQDLKDVPWVNIFFSDKKSATPEDSQYIWSSLRLPGLATVPRREDILVYQQAYGFYIVKRCMALPGDTLTIKNGETYINGKHRTPSKDIKEDYQIRPTNTKPFFSTMDSLGINGPFSPIPDTSNLIRATLSQNEMATLQKNENYQVLQKDLDKSLEDRPLFANPEENAWTLDNMGPLIVPKKGMKIKINPKTYALYGAAISDFEGQEWKENNGIYYNKYGEKIEVYTFTQDFCFLMGDNRKHSIDSRYFGFVPVSNIIGKVPLILFSTSSWKSFKERFFKKLNP